MKPEDQFQIGDRVIYVQEGIRTKVAGYILDAPFGAMPHVIGYELDCGITVPREALKFDDIDSHPIEGGKTI